MTHLGTRRSASSCDCDDDKSCFGTRRRLLPSSAASGRRGAILRLGLRPRPSGAGAGVRDARHGRPPPARSGRRSSPDRAAAAAAAPSRGQLGARGGGQDRAPSVPHAGPPGNTVYVVQIKITRSSHVRRFG